MNDKLQEHTINIGQRDAKKLDDLLVDITSDEKIVDLIRERHDIDSVCMSRLANNIIRFIEEVAENGIDNTGWLCEYEK